MCAQLLVMIGATKNIGALKPRVAVRCDLPSKGAKN